MVLRRGMVVIDISADQVTGSASNQNIAGKVLAASEAFKTGGGSETVGYQLHLPTRILVGNDVRKSKRDGRVSGGKGIAGRIRSVLRPELARLGGKPAVCRTHAIGRILRHLDENRSVDHGLAREHARLQQVVVMLDHSSKREGADRRHWNVNAGKIRSRPEVIDGRGIRAYQMQRFSVETEGSTGCSG